jgi:hypothetical protein
MLKYSIWLIEYLPRYIGKKIFNKFLQRRFGLLVICKFFLITSLPLAFIKEFKSYYHVILIREYVTWNRGKYFLICS